MIIGLKRNVTLVWLLFCVCVQGCASEAKLSPATPVVQTRSGAVASAPQPAAESEQTSASNPTAAVTQTSQVTGERGQPEDSGALEEAPPARYSLSRVGRLREAVFDLLLWSKSERSSAQAAALGLGVPSPEPPQPSATGSSPALRWRPKKTLWIGESYLYHAVFAEEAHSLYTYSEQTGALRRFETNKWSPQGAFSTPNFVEFDSAALVNWPGVGLMFSDKGGIELVGAQGERTKLNEFPATRLRLGRSIAFGTVVGASRAYIPQQKSELRFFGLDQSRTRLTQLAELYFDERVEDWALCHGGRVLAVLLYPSDQIEIIDLAASEVVGTIKTPRYASTLALSPDQRWLAVVGERVELYDLETRTLLGTDDTLGNNAGNAAFTPQQDLLVVTAYDGKARSYVLPRGEKAQASPSANLLPRPQLLKHSGQANVYGISFSPDGRWLATSSGDQTVKIWKR